MTETRTDQSTREAWLEQAIEALRPRFIEAGLPLPEKIHVSVGFGYAGRAESKHILAQCWKRCASADGVNHIFISPVGDDPALMLSWLVHELIHAADDNESGHRGEFKRVALALGLVGPMVATTAGVELAAELITLAAALGEFPHSKLDPRTADVPAPTPGQPAPVPHIWSGPPKQSTRMIKVAAPCGYTVRTTAKWLAVGAPLCPHGDEMV